MTTAGIGGAARGVSGGRGAADLARSLALAAALGAALGCGGRDEPRTTPPVIDNRAPVVHRIRAIPERVHTDEDITLTADATDADGDRLSYRWGANRGTFPNGVITVGAVWHTALDRAADTVLVRVTDAEDTVAFRQVFELSLPAPPGPPTPTMDVAVIDIAWDKSPDEGIRHWRGYRLYAADHSLAGLSGDEVAPFLVNETPFTDLPRVARVRFLPSDGSRLRIGRRYYFHLRSFRSYPGHEELSEASAEVDASPRPSYVLEVFREFRGTQGRSAVDLSAGSARPINLQNPTDLSSYDLYLGTEAAEEREGTLYLKSVSELAPLNPAFAARQVSIKRLDESWDAYTTTDDGWQTQALVERGAAYAVKLPEGNYAKLRVTGDAGSYPERFIQLQWAYQTIPNYPRF